MLRPDRVKVLHNENHTAIIGYEYRHNGKTANFKPEEILAIKNFNPEL